MPTKPGWWNAVAGYTAQMQTAYLAWIERGAARWPDVRVVFALLAGGGPFQLERLRSRGVDTRRLSAMPLYFETSSYGRLALELCLSAYGVERLVHGSDFPVVDTTPTMSAIEALGKATAHAICSANPESLLHRPDHVRDQPVSDRAPADAARAARLGGRSWRGATPLAEPGTA
jgi:predicted TIM-barrel fold metal-dependent hydrolase